MLLTLGLLTLVACYFAVPYLYMRGLRRRLQQVCTEHRLIALTFDDGPGRLVTPLVLKRLADARVKASFFALGRNVTDNADLVHAIRADGHSIGSHGQQHIHHWRSKPLRTIRDSNEGLSMLSKVLDCPSTDIIFRPPYNRLNLFSWLALVFRGIRIGSFTQDTYDTWPNDEVSPNMVLNVLRNRGGGVVLLHDHERTKQGAAGEMLRHLDALPELRKEGYRFVSYHELFAHLQEQPITVGKQQAPQAPALPSRFSIRRRSAGRRSRARRRTRI